MKPLKQVVYTTTVLVYAERNFDYLLRRQPGAVTGALCNKQNENAFFEQLIYIETIILPRQARDKHRGSLEQRMRVLQVLCNSRGKLVKPGETTKNLCGAADGGELSVYFSSFLCYPKAISCCFQQRFDRKGSTSDENVVAKKDTLGTAAGQACVRKQCVYSHTRQRLCGGNDRGAHPWVGVCL